MIFEIITVGIPFSLFKIIAGKSFEIPLLIAIGVVDLLMNATNLFGLMVIKRKLLKTCTITFIVSRFRNSKLLENYFIDFGNSLDTLMAFILVAVMIAFDQISHLPILDLQIWNWAVVLNVLGAGSLRVRQSLLSLKNNIK